MRQSHEKDIRITWGDCFERMHLDPSKFILDKFALSAFEKALQECSYVKSVPSVILGFQVPFQEIQNQGVSR